METQRARRGSRLATLFLQKQDGVFHMTPLKFKLENYQSPWDFTFMMIAWRAAQNYYYMTAERAVMLVKKVTYLGEFGYLSSSCIRKKII